MFRRSFLKFLGLAPAAAPTVIPLLAEAAEKPACKACGGLELIPVIVHGNQRDFNCTDFLSISHETLTAASCPRYQRDRWFLEMADIGERAVDAVLKIVHEREAK